MRWQWVADLGISKKLLLLVCPALIGSLIYAGAVIKQEYDAKQNLNSILLLVSIAERNSDLVHQLQKERGMSAGYIGSKGSAFRQKLPNQRGNVDREVRMLQEMLQSSQIPSFLRTKINSIDASLSKLSSIRQSVDSLSISLPEQVKFYTQLNNQLLSVIDIISKQAKDATISNKVSAFSAYLQMKERAGIERAISSSIFGKSQLPAAKLAKLLTLIAEQNAYQERFMALSAGNDLSGYKSLLASNSIKQVEKFRRYVLNQDTSIIEQQDPEEWFSVATSRIELLRKTEKQLSSNIVALTQNKLNDASNLLFTNIVIMVSMFTAVLFLTLSIAGYLKRTIKNVSGQVLIAGEKLDLTTRITAEGRDEFGALANTFNKMMGEIEQVIVNARASTVSITDAIEVLSLSCEQMNSDVQIGQSEAEQVASAMSEMSATVSQIAGNAAEAAKASNEANKEAQQGNGEVEKTDLCIRELANEMQMASNTIDALDDEIHRIVGVLDVISGIAEQTNLLALNAAIEAARAGESGRGFAVVADEVRSLAQRAKASTADIKNMTDRLQSGASEAVQAMARGMEKADESVEEVKLAGEDLKDIVQYVSTIDEMNIQIATATEQQSCVTEEVNANAIRINELYQNSKSVASEIMQLNEQLSVASLQLSERVSQFKVS
ncbi:methyl-accepting chemotaxis protein [Parashewanella curva]|uniref:Methyl-accepting chemotaxis protein n=1 Tax=Parashewanella curva TaxID=2338552 RepID=A0A3L8Q2M0_9GAMM|nr:methyl-accepting chemotaxis protein [Parashewanella curva]RLV61123.1 methyl-accepting chemotaxis protein [Parashewanella curva]